MATAAGAAVTPPPHGAVGRAPCKPDASGSVATDYPCFAHNRRVAPEITLVVPVYDTPGPFLDVCLGSVLRQTVRPREILIVDDGTTLAETRVRLDALRDLPGITVARSERNLGLSRTMNRALRLCPTRFLLKLDSDDIARPRLVERLSAFIAQNGEVDVLGCQCQNFGKSNITTMHPERVTKQYVVSSPRYWLVNHSGVLLNRDSLLAVKGYLPIRGIAEDYELWVRMMLRGFRRFHNLQEVLVDYRDLPTGLHYQFRRGINRAMLIALKKIMWLCPRF